MARKSGINKTIVANVVVILALAGTSTYFYMQNRDLNSQLALTDQDRVAQQNEELLADVGKLYDLPEEEPTIFLVNDPVKTQEDNPGIKDLFSDLKKDDYLLVYKTERLGIQYRPSEKKIIKTATLTIPISVELFGSEQAMEDISKVLEEKYSTQVSIKKTILEGVTKGFVFDTTTKLGGELDNISKETGLEKGINLPDTIKPDSQT
ncbi:hypothetical protein KBB49_03255, partial [Candidatus Saccharibacteria bacterium]|nr:hypothetical protein [Candidatus Saccharibacteria bacterium]